MKPSENQLEGLQKYLKSVLTYQESYEEIYDHILSAIEIMSDDTTFEIAVNNVIKRDFGGHDNLSKVEQGIGTGIYFSKKHLFNIQLKSLLNFKDCSWVLIAGISIYYIIAILSLSPIILKTVALALAFIPSIVALIWLFNLGYRGGQRGLYAVDKSITNIAFFPLWVLYNIIVWFPIVFTWFPDIWNREKAIVPTVFLLAATIYTVAFIRFYRLEFKSFSAKKNEF